MIIENEIKLGFDDVLIKPKRSTLESRKFVQLERTYEFLNSKQTWSGIPIVAANMDTIGTFEMHKALSKHTMITALHKHLTPVNYKENKDSYDFNFGFPSIGAKEDDLDYFFKVLSVVPAQFVCIDVANGYNEKFADFVKRVRGRFPYITIIAGNVVTGEMTQQLILSGADVVKVGIGPGSMCTTRMTTGVGYPQLSAIIECADAAHGMKAHIMADGGCRTPGDVAKAFGAGADFVMLGGMFAGHKECGGKTDVGPNGQIMRQFYGMSSEIANDKYSGGLDNYRAAEGTDIWIYDKGSVSKTVQQILGGLRSACTYVGAPNLKSFSKCTTFIRVNQIHHKYED